MGYVDHSMVDGPAPTITNATIRRARDANLALVGLAASILASMDDEAEDFPQAIRKEALPDWVGR